MSKELAKHVPIVDCPKCLERLPPTKRPAFKKIRRLTTLGEIVSWPGLVKETPYKHHVDEGAVLAYYSLPKSQRTHCIRGHRPRSGAIYYPRCDEGIAFVLGWICAAHTVHGFEKIEHHEKDAAKYFDQLDTINAFPELAAEVEKLVTKLIAYNSRRDEQRDSVFGRKMLRLANGPTRDKQVPIEFEERKTDKYGNSRVTKEVRHAMIAGLEYWRTPLDVPRAQRVLHNVRLLLVESGMLDREDADDVARLSEKGRMTGRELSWIRDVVRLCDTFWAEGNLSLAVRA